jgi:hypothetical protein
VISALAQALGVVLLLIFLAVSVAAQFRRLWASEDSAERLAYLTSVLPGPTAKNPKRKPTPKQLADHAATGLCTAESPPHASAIIFLPECHNGSVDLASIDRFRVAFASIGEVVCDMDRLATVMRARAIGASALPGS